MNERIKELAEQAGLKKATAPSGLVGDYIWGAPNDLERFAELVRQDEREACAKLCENLDEVECATAGRCATAIRARGDKNESRSNN